MCDQVFICELRIADDEKFIRMDTADICGYYFLKCNVGNRNSWNKIETLCTGVLIKSLRVP